MLWPVTVGGRGRSTGRGLVPRPRPTGKRVLAIGDEPGPEPLPGTSDAGNRRPSADCTGVAIPQGP